MLTRIFTLIRESTRFEIFLICWNWHLFSSIRSNCFVFFICPVSYIFVCGVGLQSGCRELWIELETGGAPINWGKFWWTSVEVFLWFSHYFLVILEYYYNRQKLEQDILATLRVDSISQLKRSSLWFNNFSEILIIRR